MGNRPGEGTPSRSHGRQRQLQDRPGVSTSKAHSLAGRADRMIWGWNSKRPLGVTQPDLGAQGQSGALGQGRLAKSLSSGWALGVPLAVTLPPTPAAKPVAIPPAGGGGVLAPELSRCFLSLLQQLSEVLPSQHPPAQQHAPSPRGPHNAATCSIIHLPFSFQQSPLRLCKFL